MNSLGLKTINKSFILQFLRILLFIPAITVVWVVSGDLPNGVMTGKKFWFYGVIVVISVNVFIYSLFARKSFYFSWQDVFVILFCVSGLAVTWFHNGSLSNKGIMLLLVVSLYFCLRYMLQNNFKGSALLMLFLLITGLVEAFWGLLQLYGFCRSYHNLYQVTGSFFNPSPYAGYLAMVIPIAVNYCLFDSRVYLSKRSSCFLLFYFRGGISILVLISVFVILPSTMSRAAWLAAAGGSIWPLVAYYRRKRKLQKTFIIFRRLIAGRRKYIIIFIAFILFAGVYYFKKDSADGRLLIWKISTQVIIRHPFGVGSGNFAGSYGEQQASYFASEAGTAQEHYVAGSPDYGFNEYLQIGVEYGIHGLLLFIAIVCNAVFAGIKTKRSAVVGSLGALLIFASMSYPFNVLPICIFASFMFCRQKVWRFGKAIWQVYYSRMVRIITCHNYSQHL